MSPINQENDSNKNMQAKTTKTINQEQPKNEPKKKKSKKLKISLIVLMVIVGIPVLIAGWYGFVPGLSNLLGARTPRDLGVVWTEENYISYRDKTGGEFLDFANAPDNPNKPGKKTVFADPEDMKVTLTDKEISATVNLVDWQWMPITNTQIKFSDDSVEVSGKLNTDHIVEFAEFIGGVSFSQDELTEAKTWLNRFARNVPVYLKMSGDISNGKLNMNVQQVQLGRFSLPANTAENLLVSATESALKNADNFEARNVRLKDGSLYFDGTTPTTVYVKH